MRLQTCQARHLLQHLRLGRLLRKRRLRIRRPVMVLSMQAHRPLRRLHYPPPPRLLQARLVHRAAHPCLHLHRLPASLVATETRVHTALALELALAAPRPVASLAAVMTVPTPRMLPRSGTMAVMEEATRLAALVEAPGIVVMGAIMMAAAVTAALAVATGQDMTGMEALRTVVAASTTLSTTRSGTVTVTGACRGRAVAVGGMGPRSRHPAILDIHTGRTLGQAWVAAAGPHPAPPVPTTTTGLGRARSTANSSSSTLAAVAPIATASTAVRHRCHRAAPLAAVALLPLAAALPRRPLLLPLRRTGQPAVLLLETMVAPLAPPCPPHHLRMPRRGALK